MTATRRRPDRAATIGEVAEGDVDPMSQLARRCYIDLCGAWEPLSKAKAAGPTCTRAAGHSEGLGRGTGAGHPSLTHVSAPGPNSIALKVWF